MLNQTMGTCEFPGSLNRGYDSKKPKGKKKKAYSCGHSPCPDSESRRAGAYPSEGVGRGNQQKGRSGSYERLRGCGWLSQAT